MAQSVPVWVTESPGQYVPSTPRLIQPWLMVQSYSPEAQVPEMIFGHRAGFATPRSNTATPSPFFTPLSAQIGRSQSVPRTPRTPVTPGPWVVNRSLDFAPETPIRTPQRHGYSDIEGEQVVPDVPCQNTYVGRMSYNCTPGGTVAQETTSPSSWAKPVPVIRSGRKANSCHKTPNYGTPDRTPRGQLRRGRLQELRQLASPVALHERRPYRQMAASNVSDEEDDIHLLQFNLFSGEDDIFG